ncbi:MAG: hypothetical protein ACLGXA_01755 [Acidobacteriota bacterium]
MKLQSLHTPMAAPRLSRWFRTPAFLLALAAGLIAFIVQSGELGTSDTQHRLNAAHALWTSDPPVFPDEYPEFGIHGRAGKLQTWYGIGQPLLMLPADIVGTGIENLPLFAAYYGTDPSVRNIIVSSSTNILLAVLTALVAFRLLRRFGFSERHAFLGVLALLVCTTHLHYTQNLMENNYIFLLTLTGFCFEEEWVRTASRRALLIGAGALGLNLLTRLTTGLDLLAGILFVLLTLWMEGARGPVLRTRLKTYALTAAPIFGFCLLLDRLYQFYRFGSFTNTYLALAAQEARQQDPALPLNYPWTTPFHSGFFGALFSPEKSIFLFDPLLILAILMTALLWKKLIPTVRAYALATLLLLVAYISFYARYFVWSGDFAWGDRYVSTAVELATLLAVPLLLACRRRVSRLVWTTGVALVAVSAVVQLASVAFWLSLEEFQMETLGHPTFVIALRMKNIVAFAFGKTQAWHLNLPAPDQDAWDTAHITTWNFLPFLLQRVGVAPVWVLRTTFAVWCAGLAALAGTLWQSARILARSSFLPDASSKPGPASERGRPA